MNLQTAAVAGGIAFLLSLLAGLLGGVPFFDLLVRALFWAVIGFGGCLGAEALLRSLVPDLFQAREDSGPADEPEGDRRVDITLDEESPSRDGGFIEEVDEDEPPAPRYRSPAEPPLAAAVPAAVSAPEATAASAEGEEEMPEIGSFLDAFKPGAAEGEEGEPARSPEIGEYAPVESDYSPPSRSSGGQGADGEQDPVILAKAIQTVMKRDAQGN